MIIIENLETSNDACLCYESPLYSITVFYGRGCYKTEKGIYLRYSLFNKLTQTIDGRFAHLKAAVEAAISAEAFLNEVSMMDVKFHKPYFLTAREDYGYENY